MGVSVRVKVAQPVAITELLVRILTPRRLVFEGPAERVELTTLDGIIEILPRHEALMTPLAIAPMILTPPNGAASLTFAVLGGFLDLDGLEATILADSAEKGSEVDVERARLAMQRARDRLAENARANSEASVDVDRAQLALVRSITRLRAAGQPPRIG